MSYELTVRNYELMVIDNGVVDLLTATLEAKCHQTDKEATDLCNLLQAEQHWVGKAMHAHAFEFPELAELLRIRVNQLAELNKLPKVADNVDPITQKDKEGKEDPNVKKHKEDHEAQEEAEVQQMKMSTVGRQLKRECNEVFRRISRRCHPDRTSDKSLWPVFDTAKKAHEDLNLSMLRSILSDVQNYIKVRSTNKTFKKYLEKLLKHKQKNLNELLIQKAEFHNTLEYKAYKARSANRKITRYNAYKRVIDAKLEKVEMALAMRRAQLEEQQRRTSYTIVTFTGGTSFTTFG
jgi:hypothetical protein